MSGKEIEERLIAMGIQPKSALHCRQHVVFLESNYDPGTISLIKKFKGRYSSTHKSWYVPRLKSLLEKLVQTLAKRKGLNLQTEEMRTYLQVLKLKGYSINTIRCYSDAFSLFLDHIYPAKAADRSRPEIEDFLLHLAQNKKYSESAIHTMVNAIKFFLEHVLLRPKEFYDLPRPRKPLQLPNILGEREIGRLFNAVTSTKQKAILFTAYSAGLRISEVVNLKLGDMDSDRMQIKVERSKGKKDRMVPLSPVLLDILRSYYRMCNPKPVKYLFEGNRPGQPYSARSAQKVFQKARKDAGILKNVSFHSLRHSFATHLLEKGIDIRYIRDLLGHFSISTTERYLHVKREQLVAIESPFDQLWKRGTINW